MKPLFLCLLVLAKPLSLLAFPSERESEWKDNTSERSSPSCSENDFYTPRATTPNNSTAPEEVPLLDSRVISSTEERAPSFVLKNTTGNTASSITGIVANPEWKDDSIIGLDQGLFVEIQSTSPHTPVTRQNTQETRTLLLGAVEVEQERISKKVVVPSQELASSSHDKFMTKADLVRVIEISSTATPLISRPNSKGSSPRENTTLLHDSVSASSTSVGIAASRSYGSISRSSPNPDNGNSSKEVMDVETWSSPWTWCCPYKD